MATSFLQVTLCLMAGIAVIILLTAKYRVHAFCALIIACFIMGVGVQMPVAQVIAVVKEGFGNIMRSLALIIVLGTTLGILLEHTKSTQVMASFILKKLGESKSPIAMSITGFIVGLPIFCDSGYIVLSGLNQSLARRTAIPVAVMAVSLATGLYSVHCLIPPHPGAAAAAGIIGADFGKLILAGIVVAIPASIAGFFWARYAGKTSEVLKPETNTAQEANAHGPSVLRAFLPVVVPIMLIALSAFIAVGSKDETGWLGNMIILLGDPVIALSIGVLLAFAAGRSWTKDTVSAVLQESAEKAGGILVIIGAGGAFGAILAATKIGEQFSQVLPLESMGLLFPFLLTVILKTAQGSSTVAIITAASIIKPLLPALGLASANGQLLCVLSMGAGSMMISHANDAYFWVIAKFSGLEMKTMLKVYTISTILMGMVSILTVYLLSLFLL